MTGNTRETRFPAGVGADRETVRVSDLYPDTPNPDALATCLRCGALSLWKHRGRHLRHHERLDQLEELVQSLEDGAPSDVLEFGGEVHDGIEADPAGDRRDDSAATGPHL